MGSCGESARHPFYELPKMVAPMTIFSVAGAAYRGCSQYRGGLIASGCRGWGDTDRAGPEGGSGALGRVLR